MINKELLKVLSIFSIIIGAILGVLPLIPALTGIAFFLLLFIVSPFILIYFKHIKIIEDYNMEKCLIIGAISGAIACVGFTLIYFPIAFILQLIFKINSFIWIKVLFTNIGFVIPMVFFTSIISAISNSFSAFLIAYYFEFIKQNKQ
ncbi:MAG: hypothetical protein E7Z90_02235 [Cyanobacteria bacterium SIG29]|nr:hypothetical protein [Cyanobacteria bacterium SIG29]